MTDDDKNLDHLFAAYRAACPEVEASAHFMPNLWQRIDARHTFGFVFQNFARTTMAGCAALCVLLVVLNFALPGQGRAPQSPNYTDVLLAEHTAENTDYAEAIRAAANNNEEAAPVK